MSFVAITLALAALAYAYLVQRKLNQLNRQLSRASSHVYQLSTQVENLSEQLEARDRELRFEIKRAAGQIEFGPRTTIADIQEQHPFGTQILASFHMGGCHSCAVEAGETVSQACARLGVDETALLAALANGRAAIPPANIALEF